MEELRVTRQPEPILLPAWSDRIGCDDFLPLTPVKMTPPASPEEIASGNEHARLVQDTTVLGEELWQLNMAIQRLGKQIAHMEKLLRDQSLDKPTREHYGDIHEELCTRLSTATQRTEIITRSLTLLRQRLLKEGTEYVNLRDARLQGTQATTRQEVSDTLAVKDVLETSAT